jgi:hypothetical protein
MSWGAWQGLTQALSHLVEMEGIVRARSRMRQGDPDKDLPDVQLSERERRDALEREIDRRNTAQ